MSTDVLDRLGEIDQQDVVRCARVLLRRPLLRAAGPDGELLPLVYRHRATLTELFTQVLGYRLVVERRFARLYKTGPGKDPTRGEPSLGPRGYAYLALCIACLSGIGPQTLLSRLVTDVRTAATRAGLDISDDLGELRAMASALRYLVSLGVVSETDGSVTGLASSAGSENTAEALLTIDTTLLGQLVAGPIGTAGTATELLALAARPGVLGVEHTVRRRLVEFPVTHYADLSDEEAAWLRKRGRHESRLLERCFGLITESRLEGMAVTDPEDYLTDIAFPGQSTAARIALLALPELLSGVADEHGRVAVSVDRVNRVCFALIEDFPAAWSKQVVASGPRLVAEVLRLLFALGVARPGQDGEWLVNPVGHRWLPQPDGEPRATDDDGDEPDTEEAGPPGWSLFDDDEGTP